MLQDKVATYQRCIAARYPAFVGCELRLVVGEGQYNDIVIVGERVVFRFPRFQEGVARLPALVHLLRTVRRYVTLATPDPVYTGLDHLDVGEAFLGYPLLPGEPLSPQRLATIVEGRARHRLGVELARFLQELHAVPVEEAVPGGAATFDPLVPWAELYTRIRTKLFPFMRPDAQREARAHFEAFLTAPKATAIQPAVIHGDFGTGNVLYDAQTRQLTGVLDFDHDGLGDPAVDLAAAQSFELPSLLETYPGSEALAARARFYRGTFVLQEALYGVEHDDEEAFARSIAPYR